MFKSELRFLKSCFLLLWVAVLGCSPTREGFNANGAGNTAARIQGADSESKAVQIVAIDLETRTATTYGGLSAADLPQPATVDSTESEALGGKLEKLMADWQKAGQPALRHLEGGLSDWKERLASLGVAHGAGESLALSGGNRGCVVSTGRTLTALAALASATVPLDSAAWVCSCAIGVVGLCMATVRR